MDSSVTKPRRWFQFRLTTWFVLVAILAWAMMLGLRAKRTEFFRVYLAGSPRSAAERREDIEQLGYLISLREDGDYEWKDLGTYTYGSTSYREFEITRLGINPRLLYPALTLAAFVGWKAAWAVGRRVAGRKVEQA